jgi:lambda repressor-like predicted transcriptional regulator
MNRSGGRTRQLIERYNDLLNEYNELVRRWNRYVASRATQAQQVQVRKLRKAGHTLREIAHETGLSLPTLRTIVGHQAIGRPLRASEAQQAQVRKLRGLGKTLRQIAHETNLSFQTIRTIIGRKDGLDRATRRKNDLRKIALAHGKHGLL